MQRRQSMRTVAIVKIAVGIAIGLFGFAVKTLAGGIEYDIPSVVVMASLALSAVILVNGVVDIYVHNSEGETPWWEREEL